MTVLPEEDLPEENSPVLSKAGHDRLAALLDGSFLTEAVELAPVGIALLQGPEHRFSYANRAYRQLLRRNTAITGRPAAAVFPEFALEGCLPLVDEVYLTRRTVRRREFSVLRETGEQVYYDFDHIPLAGKDGAVRAVLVLASDVTDRVAMRQAIEARAAEAEQAQQLLEGLLAFIPEGITIADAPDVIIRHVSEYGKQVTGRTAEELEGIPAEQHVERWNIFQADGVTPALPEELPLTRATRRGEVVTAEEWVLRHVDGRELSILCNAGPIRDRDGTITGGVIAWRDISAVKQVQADLRDALIQKELLLGEVNHRVKNSLQLVSALLGIQARETSSPATRRELKEAAARVHAIAKLHERLYLGAGVQRIEFGGYLRSLCEELAESAPEHVCDLEAEPAELPIETAVALGLIFVELFTNAMKHANPPDGNRCIAVRFGPVGAGKRGIERPGLRGWSAPGFFPGQRTHGFGMRVILGMVRQLSAELTAENASPGARWTLRLAVDGRNFHGGGGQDEGTKPRPP